HFAALERVHEERFEPSHGPVRAAPPEVVEPHGSSYPLVRLLEATQGACRANYRSGAKLRPVEPSERGRKGNSRKGPCEPTRAPAFLTGSACALDRARTFCGFTSPKGAWRTDGCGKRGRGPHGARIWFAPPEGAF